MLNFLKNHPFAVEAYFESSTVLTFAIPKAELQNMIPPCVELDTFQDKWAFIAVAMVKTKSLRPKGFPAFMGNNFFLIGYRIFVRYTTPEGKRLRGLFILKSETNKKKMEYLGNIFTHYNYTTTDIQSYDSQLFKNIKSEKSGLDVSINPAKKEVNLPANSPFANWKEARRFAGPLPFTFTFDAEKNEVLIIEGVRQNWKPKPVEVEKYHFDFINSFGFSEANLANAFVVENIPYSWKKGKTEQWKQQ
ncbi:MAG: hypothetical protein ACJAWV_003168 [Flammeovirgaceae bacterium]|jgi:hypothetical protein